jgi:hypothetical protein
MITKYDRHPKGLIGAASPAQQVTIREKLNRASDRLEEALDLAQRMFDELDAAYTDVLEGEPLCGLA